MFRTKKKNNVFISDVGTGPVYPSLPPPTSQGPEGPLHTLGSLSKRQFESSTSGVGLTNYSGLHGLPFPPYPPFRLEPSPETTLGGVQDESQGAKEGEWLEWRVL